jgi:hypothetical protein
MGLFNDYERPEWLLISIDNFWLLRAMRFGFPGIILLLATIFIAAKGTAKRIESSNPAWSSVSLAQLCALIGSIVSLATVDIWSGSHTLLFFSLGSMVSLNQSYAREK